LAQPARTIKSPGFVEQISIFILSVV